MSPLEKASPESVKAAKAQMLRERFDVMRETGVVIRPDGTILGDAEGADSLALRHL